jgi:hypothetical protein
MREIREILLGLHRSRWGGTARRGRRQVVLDRRYAKVKRLSRRRRTRAWRLL